MLRVGEAVVTLPNLNGSPAQVRWANGIRAGAIVREDMAWERLNVLIHIVDSTWWIANRVYVERDGQAKWPAVTQMLGNVWPPGCKGGEGKL